MLGLAPVGLPVLPAAGIERVADESPSVSLRQRVEDVFQSAKQYAPVFQMGAAASLLAIGSFSFLGGMGAIFQAYSDKNLTDVGLSGVAMIVGIVQCIGAEKLMNRSVAHFTARDFNANIVDIFGASIAGAAICLPAGKLGELAMGPAMLPSISPATRIAIGLFVQTSAGVLIGGTAAVTTVVLMKGVIRLYYFARDAYARRENPDAAVELMEANH